MKKKAPGLLTKFLKLSRIVYPTLRFVEVASTNVQIDLFIYLFGVVRADAGSG